jgi:fluoride exporter
MSAGTWIAVALLGGVGAVVRFAVDWLVSLRLGFRFPFGILVVNLSGAFLLGTLAGAGVQGNAQMLAGTAVLGAYTTFSTWMLDTQELAQRGETRAAILNIAIGAAAGLAAVAIGHAVGSAA